MAGLKERLERDKLRRRRKWPRKRFADGSLWILHPSTFEPDMMIEPPDPSKGWKEVGGKEQPCDS